MGSVRIACATASLLLIAGCGGGSPTTVTPPSVTSVSLSQSAATLSPQQTVTLVATPKDASGNTLTGRTITWASNPATVATVDGNGMITAVSVGAATVTATCEGKSASATITVAAVVVPVATVTLSQASATIVAGQTVTLIATPKDAAGNALTGRGVTWISTVPSIATVDGNGVVTPVAVGTTTITATSEGQSASATITVNPGTFLGPAGGTASGFSGGATVTIPAGALSSGLVITIAQVANPQPDARLAPGTAYDFGPTGTTFSAPVTLAIRYDPALLAAGTNQAQLRVHRLVGTTWTPLPGSSVNTATHVVSGATSSFSTYAVLEVVIPVAIVSITPNPVDLPLGMQVQLTATTKDAQGNVLTGRTVTWTSSATGTATITSAGGLVTSAAIGATTITATSEGVAAPMPLNVRSDPSARTLSVYQGSGTVYVATRGIVVIPSYNTHACAIGVDQKGYCWGGNAQGELGDGTRLDRSVPTPIALPNPLVDITVGGGFSCALDTAHNPWCWGFNTGGTFGQGAFNEGSTTPVPAASGRQFVDLSAGESMLCGIDLSGGTYCWGRNDFGSLGIGFVTPTSGPLGVPTPTRVVGDPGFVSISVGSYGACGLTAPGTAYCWGSHQVFVAAALSATLVASAPAFARISHGMDHICGLTMDRKIYCWGENESGQLGDGTTAPRTTPTLVAGGMTWRFVSAGNRHTCAITTDNRAYCWGSYSTEFESEGETGIGTLFGSLVPMQVTGGLPPLAVVSAGLVNTCGLTADGSGYCWGFRGTLGNGEYFYSAGPVQVSGVQNAQDVARGSPLGCYVNTTKQLRCWAETEAGTSAGVPSFGSFAVKAVSLTGGYAGSSACLIRDADSRVACWGDNSLGQLGNGTTVSATVPTLISSAASFNSIATGYVGACGTTTGQGLLCWGATPGVTGITSSPVQILPGVNWASVWGGEASGVCAITDQAAAYCGSFPSTFTLVAGTQRWVMMAPGNHVTFTTPPFTCGLTDTGDAYCMGDNSSGQLGDGTTISHALMAPVAGGLKFTQIVSGQLTICALTAAGAAYCWGDGTDGKLGSAPAAAFASTPTLVPGGLHFTRLAGANRGFCGVTSNALVYCWGTRYLSTLGNGERDDRIVPVPMTGGTRFLLYEPGTAGLRLLRQRP